jgi:arsenite-transporting ATPase
MEIDPSPQTDLESEFGGESGFSAEAIQGMAANLPGIDELMSFAEMMRCVEVSAAAAAPRPAPSSCMQSYDYEVVVFDTAPTGHTLRLLQFPKMLNKMLTKLGSMRGMLGMVFNQFRSMAPGMPAGADEASVLEKLDKIKDLSQRVSDMFTNADMTTFICVCIAEFLSLFETERLVQELARNSIDCHSIVVNQLLFPPKSSNCSLCGARVRMQQKYTDQIAELYEDFNVVKIPLFEEEIRGVAALHTVGNLLLNAYQNPEEL